MSQSIQEQNNKHSTNTKLGEFKSGLCKKKKILAINFGQILCHVSVSWLHQNKKNFLH